MIFECVYIYADTFLSYTRGSNLHKFDGYLDNPEVVKFKLE